MADEPGRKEEVQSPIVDLMNHFEFAALTEGADPEMVRRIRNRLLFGHPDGPEGYQAGGVLALTHDPGTRGAVDAVLAELEGRDSLTSFDKAAVRRTRGLLAGKNEDPGGYPVSYSGAI